MSVCIKIYHPLDARNWLNISDKNKCSCNCNSWKNHWIMNKDIDLNSGWPKECSAAGCNNTAEFGAVIVKESDSSNEKFIVPFCEKCYNENKKIFTLELYTIICPADESKTCGKLKELMQPKILR